MTDVLRYVPLVICGLSVIGIALSIVADISINTRARIIGTLIIVHIIALACIR